MRDWPASSPGCARSRRKRGDRMAVFMLEDEDGQGRGRRVPGDVRQVRQPRRGRCAAARARQVRARRGDEPAGGDRDHAARRRCGNAPCARSRSGWRAARSARDAMRGARRRASSGTPATGACRSSWKSTAARRAARARPAHVRGDVRPSRAIRARTSKRVLRRRRRRRADVGSMRAGRGDRGRETAVEASHGRCLTCSNSKNRSACC